MSDAEGPCHSEVTYSTELKPILEETAAAKIIAVGKKGRVSGPPTTVVAAQRPCPQPLHMSGNKINTTRTIEIPPFDGTESVMVWLRRAKFYLQEISEADRPWTLLKALAPKQLDKALDAGLDADLPFDALCQRLANLFSQTYSFGDAMEQLQERRLKQDETLSQLVQDLERLTTVAFPSLGSEDKDDIVLHYLIKALPSSELSRSRVLQRPGDLRDAIHRAERYIMMDSATQGHPKHSYRHHWRRPDLA
nr:unnamed protein product [Spirometra erinaceieuropaei]